jgi:translation initiation factor 3 subunit L
MSDTKEESTAPVETPNVETPASNDPPVLPELINNFIAYFYAHVLKNNVQEIHVIYESSFNQITDRLYQNSRWPSVETIAPLVNQSG